MTAPERYPWRLQLPIYTSGFFNGNVYFLTGILMPLWALIVVGEDQAFLIGLIVASRRGSRPRMQRPLSKPRRPGSPPHRRGAGTA